MECQENQELKDCPFCGGSETFFDEEPIQKTYRVCCEHCSSTSGQFCKTKEDAIKDWNHRPQEDKLKARIAELEAEIKQIHKDYGCELRDPAGTIWEHAANVQKENETLKKMIDVNNKLPNKCPSKEHSIPDPRQSYCSNCGWRGELSSGCPVCHKSFVS